MPFWPASGWGIAYATALALAVALTWCGKSRDARRVMAIMVAHWVTMRAIVTGLHDVPLAWVCHDVVTILGLAVVGRSQIAYGSAALFLVLLFFDQFWLITGGPRFEAISVVAEAVGYLVMIISAGAAHGKYGGRSGGAHGRGGIRFGDILGIVEARGPISRRSYMLGAGFACVGDDVQKDRGGK